MRKLKIALYVNPSSPATDYYRTTGPFTRLAEKGWCELILLTPDSAWWNMYQADVVVFQRANGTAALETIQEAKKQSKQVWIDHDDDLLNVNPENPASERFGNPQVKQSVLDCLALADALTVSTPPLLDLYAPHFKGGVAAIVRNAVDLQVTPMSEVKTYESITNIVWRGSMSHLADLETIRPFWKWVEVGTRTKKYEVIMIGLLDAITKTYFPKFRCLPWHPSPFSYFQHLPKMGAHIGVFPLTLDSFNLAKSNIFALEMLTAGIMPFAPKGFPEFDHPGVALYNDGADLIKKVNLLDRLTVAETVRQGQEWISENRTLEKANLIRAAIIERLTENL
jgi:hypothetical protein